ncbi:hypothetical protein FPZ12_024125 [Amycolatopsis acidicola]|uniref:Uncharacterized protein n=1 Tax=Amycolatopsis acidicola TaxID=2596893 RepID=A0A5N0V1K1_9PSEU|nr:hypothetical protein [Amycolatopsis acidicola]KAA9157972.1 hypothetical protein FPZ12_024125 [Amycolatopsis acidicola]
MAGHETPRRRRRSTATLERLEAARRRRAEQLERERENERRVDEALEPFAEAAAEIAALERKRDDRVAALKSQLERKLAELEQQKATKSADYERLAADVRAEASARVDGWRQVMATSVQQIRDADVSVSETAEMLGITPREVTTLSRANENRSSAASSSHGRAEEPDGASGAPWPAGDVE